VRKHAVNCCKVNARNQKKKKGTNRKAVIKFKRTKLTANAVRDLLAPTRRPQCAPMPAAVAKVKSPTKPNHSPGTSLRKKQRIAITPITPSNSAIRS